jgi:hypothetical protein
MLVPWRARDAEEGDMGLLDTIKDLFGSTGVGDLVESAGITEHIEGLTEAAQAPIEEISTAAEDVTSAVDPIADQL